MTLQSLERLHTRPYPPLEVAFGAAMNASRTIRCMTLAGLCKATGISQSTLANYEAGLARAPARHVIKIAAALDVTIASLYR